MTREEAKSSENHWAQLCAKHGWNESSQMAHFESFLRGKGLFGEFAAYVERAAEKEAMAALEDAIEGLGYTVVEHVVLSGRWIWLGPVMNCEVSLDTKEQATLSAWGDAMSRALAARPIDSERLEGMSLDEQITYVVECLSASQNDEALRSAGR